MFTVEAMSQLLAWDMFTYRYDYDGSGNLLYAGRAVIGSLDADAKWTIAQFEYSGANLISKKWANGENAWTDRASLAYS